MTLFYFTTICHCMHHKERNTTEREVTWSNKDERRPVSLLEYIQVISDMTYTGLNCTALVVHDVITIR